MTLQDALDYYVKTLIIQYRDKPKAIQTIECLVNTAYCDGLPLEFTDAFDLDSAVGDQLTILGRIVGVPRNVFGLDLTHSFFNFTRFTSLPASNGFARWGSPNNTILISRWQTTATYVTTDFELRALINLRIIYNNYFKSLGIIKDALWPIFGYNVSLIDNLDYTITYNLVGPYANVAAVASYIGNIFPKPMGVGINVNTFSDFLYAENGSVLTDENGNPLYAEA